MSNGWQIWLYDRLIRFTWNDQFKEWHRRNRNTCSRHTSVIPYLLSISLTECVCVCVGQWTEGQTHMKKTLRTLAKLREIFRFTSAQRLCAFQLHHRKSVYCAVEITSKPVNGQKTLNVARAHYIRLYRLVLSLPDLTFFFCVVVNVCMRLWGQKENNTFCTNSIYPKLIGSLPNDS